MIGKADTASLPETSTTNASLQKPKQPRTIMVNPGVMIRERFNIVPLIEW